MAYYVFLKNSTFSIESWRATLSQIIGLSTAEVELTALASCSSFHLVCVGRTQYLHVLVLLYVCIFALYRSW